MVLSWRRPESHNRVSKNWPLIPYSRSSDQRPSISTRNPNPEDAPSHSASLQLPLTSSTNPSANYAASSRTPSSPSTAVSWSSNPHSKDPTRNSSPFSSRDSDSSFASVSATTMPPGASLPPSLTLLLWSVQFLHTNFNVSPQHG